MTLVHNALPMAAPITSHVHKRQLTIRDDLSGYALVVGAIIASQVSISIRPAFGAYITTAAIGLLMVLAARYERVRGVILALTLLPMMQLVNLSYIAHSAFAQTFVFYMSMLMLSLMYRFMLQRRIRPVENRLVSMGYAIWIPAVIAVGLVIGVFTYVLLRGSFMFGYEAIGLVAFLAVLGAVAEESFFRGLIQRQAADVMDPKYAAILTGLVYVGVTLNHFSLWSVMAGILSTTVLSLTYVLKPNLIVTTTLNICSKLTFVVLLGVFLHR